jgi:hypothetical protein
LKTPKTTTSPTETAIVRIAPPPERPWELNEEQVTILKNSVAKGASDEELKYCLTVARRYRLDPFKQQIWFVKRWDSSADDGKGGRGAFVWTPQVGINGLLFTAARDHKDFGSVSLPEYGPMHTPDGQKFGAPEWAKVKVWKKGESEPTEAQAWWDEYAPSDLSKAPFWRKMPRRMVAKCATALAIRQAYPDLGGVYIPEECEKMNEDFTPGGRRIVDHQLPQQTADTATVEALKAKGLWCEEHQCTRSANHLKTCESSRKAMPTPKEPVIDVPSQPESRPAPSGKVPESEYRKENVPPATKQEPWKYAGTLELDYSEDASMPYIRGDIAELAVHFPKDLTLRRRNDFWCAFTEDAARIKVIALEKNFEIKIVGALEKKAKEPAAKEGLVKGTIEQANPESGKVPRVTILFRIDKAKYWMNAFDTALFPFLIAGKGQEAELFVTKTVKGDKTFTNIAGLKRVGSKEFEDGKVPVIQRAQQQPGRTLF